MFELNKQAKQKPPVYCDYDQLPHCCGVLDVGNFTFTQGEWSWEGGQRHAAEVDNGGTGIFTATFINNKVCKAAYEQLCATHQLLYQSPKKRNRNSNRDVFLCVFLHKDRK